MDRLVMSPRVKFARRSELHVLATFPINEVGFRR